MKKIILVVALILLAVPAFAADKPVAKGNFVVTLPLFSYWMGMGDLDESSKFTFLAMGYEPEVQYFVMDRLAVGGKVGYIKEELGNASTKTTSFGPLANYYFDLPKFMPYAGVGLLYEQEKSDGSKTTTISLKVQGGVVYMFWKNIAAYGEAFLSYDQMKNGSKATGQKVGLAAGVKAFF